VRADCVAPNALNLISIPDRLDVLKWLNLKRSANQSRSHPPMSVTWNLVLSAREEFPRFFKIHKRSALAMDFKHVALRENPTRAAETMMMRGYFIQRVGVARNFDAEIMR
jgi:hypothetical protein